MKESILIDIPEVIKSIGDIIPIAAADTTNLIVFVIIILTGVFCWIFNKRDNPILRGGMFIILALLIVFLTLRIIKGDYIMDKNNLDQSSIVLNTTQKSPTIIGIYPSAVSYTHLTLPTICSV